MFIEVKKSTKQKLSFYHATCLHDLIYVPTKNYQVITNSMGVMGLHIFLASGEIST